MEPNDGKDRGVYAAARLPLRSSRCLSFSTFSLSFSPSPSPSSPSATVLIISHRNYYNLIRYYPSRSSIVSRPIAQPRPLFRCVCSLGHRVISQLMYRRILSLCRAYTQRNAPLTSLRHAYLILLSWLGYAASSMRPAAYLHLPIRRRAARRDRDKRETCL